MDRESHGASANTDLYFFSPACELRKVKSPTLVCYLLSEATTGSVESSL